VVVSAVASVATCGVVLPVMTDPVPIAPVVVGGTPIQEKITILPQQDSNNFLAVNIHNGMHVQGLGHTLGETGIVNQIISLYRVASVFMNIITCILSLMIFMHVIIFIGVYKPILKSRVPLYVRRKVKYTERANVM
jgi:hypothetical protein